MIKQLFTKIPKQLRILIPISLSAAIIIVSYLHQLHTVALDGDKLFVERCTTVNPPLIMYKKSFIQFANIVNTKGFNQLEQGAEYVQIYLDGIKAYEPVEKEWLKKAETYMSSKPYQLLIPKLVKDRMKYQLEIYRAYHDEAEYMRKVSEGNIDPNGMDIMNGIRGRRYMYEEKVMENDEDLRRTPDFRYRFIRLPIPPECTKENTIIPATEGSIEWDSEEATPSSEPMPNLFFGTLG